MKNTTTIDLPGYRFGENLYQGTRTLVYGGTRTSDKQPVIIKVLRNPHPNFNELVQFRNQYVITRHLEHPAIVRPEALERYGNGYALVMPDGGGISLSEYWKKSDPNLTEFLAIAIQLAEAMHYLSLERIIHKDIKPSNILIHPETGKVKLIDFSISTLLPFEQQQLINPNVLEGTLAYISPEQTGRMNRGIDYRTDFYSLGATFFELLTGKLPFATRDPMELVHCHIAKMPPALGKRQEARGNRGVGDVIPAVLSDIVLKLMAKNAEDRYQSALGLKHDLERCLQELEATGEIGSFEIGERDKSDRFIIPEKLYGRETEVQTLLNAFERVSGGTTEMMLVAGFSGIGKTAVVNEVHKPIVEKRGYFIKGKFDQFNRNIPFSAFVIAFRDLMGQLLGSSDGELANWKAKILDALGDNARVIIDVVPELERIIGKQPPGPELSGSAAQNRFNLLFQQFVAVFTVPEHPLVMFLDDLQWADSASLNLMKVLMSDKDTGYLLLLGAYRDNEVFPAHPLMLLQGELQKERAVISTITLEPLAVHQINQLVAETLSCSEELAQPLTELVYQKTQGNPFFTTQFLKGLHEEKLVAFNRNLGYWECDLVRVRDAALTSDVVEFMVRRLHKLPEKTQEILKLAACIGNQFDLNTLAIISEQSSMDAAAALWSALQDGLVLPIAKLYQFFQEGEATEFPDATAPETINAEYKFLHDRVQQAAYSLINEELKPETHLKIGRLLLSNRTASEMEETIFDLTNQLNRGHSLIGDRREKDELARLNLIAARKAKSSTAYLASTDYLNLGIQLLEDGWNRDYDLMLSLYLELIESEYINTHFDSSKALADLALQQANSLLDRLKIHELQIQYYIAKNERKQAVDLGIYALELLDIELDGIAVEVADIEALADLPEMTEPSQIQALRILTAMVSAAVIAAVYLLVPIALKMVNICINYGNSKLAPYSYGFHAWMLCSFLGEIDAGYRFGKLAVKLLDKFNAKELKCKVYQQFNVFVRHRKEPLENLKELIEGFKSGIEVGDIEYACYSAKNYCVLQFFLGKNLASSLEEQKKYFELIQSKKQVFSVAFLSPWLQLTSNLLSASVEGYLLIGDFYDERERIPVLQEQNQSLLLFPVFFIKTYLSYLLERYEIALKNAINAEGVGASSNGFIYYPAYLFYFSLALLACYSRSGVSQKQNTERQHFIDRVNENQKELQSWVKDAPFTYQHKYDLVLAEYHRVLEERLEAMELYDRSIAGAKENGFIQEEALANELAAKFYLEWGKETIAAAYMQKAYYCYARWSAKAKTDQLEAKYPQLLTPILQQQRVEFNPIDSLDTLTKTLTSVRQDATHTGTQISEALDFASILQAVQILSGSIELDQLLAKIVHIILTNAGAQKTVLLIPHDDEQWQLRAMAKLTDDGTVETSTKSQPLTPESPVPVRLVQYVKNTRESVLIDEGKTEIAGILLKYKPQSAFCVPLLERGNLVAILYLEHLTTKGVFTRNRQTIIEFLCTQAAIALQNAQLYQQAKLALRDLQQAQLQLVQSEKMSAIGNLVAGVAHEINNPVGFLQGNIEPARDYVADLLGLIELYQQKMPNPDAEIEEEIEAIDLEFIREDLPKLLESMNVGVERIRSISKSLRTFSRKDRESKTEFNIHEGIDSTLVILKHRTKANQERPVVEIVKDYGDLPVVQCFPGQLNQVFMNILANAIDAFDEANEGKSYTEIEASPNCITIRTSMVDNWVEIKIIDNGCGMKPSTVGRIFEQGFTTKGVGKGTGLGMAIAHNIVTEKHGGTITCDSKIGVGTTFAIILPIA